MTQTQEQKLNAYLVFRDYFLKDTLYSEIQPPLKLHFEDFLHHLNLILKTRDMIDENRKMFENYSFIREEVIKITVSLSRKVTAYALLEEMIDVMGTFCFNYDELANETDSKLLNQCKSIYYFISNHQSELIDYDIDLVLINSYNNLIDQFQLTLENKSLCCEIDTMHTTQFTELFHKTEELFENQLVTLNQLVIKPT